MFNNLILDSNNYFFIKYIYDSVQILYKNTYTRWIGYALLLAVIIIKNLLTT